MSDVITVLKTASCPSISGKSTLTYDTGCDQNHDAYFRITSNTGGGIYCKAWFPVILLEPLLASKEPITAAMIRKLFAGKSVNTATFITAVLLAEGLLTASDNDSRQYLPKLLPTKSTKKKPGEEA